MFFFLAKLKDSDYHESLAIFKLIMRFMNDPNLTGRKETALGDYIVQKGLVNESLRDEILCQLCNQTWKNDNESSVERGWLLMANCLSCFPPSKTLYKYLLKYVSDHAYNGYKATCQRKLLQSERVDPYLIRTFPPCMLEWRANRKHMNTALEVAFPDGVVRYGPVESWTSGEQFAAALVKERRISESWGWTVSLRSYNNTVELSGHDYVLDLIGELEIPPAFPICKSTFLTSHHHDKDREKPSVAVGSASAAGKSDKRKMNDLRRGPNPDVMKALEVDVVFSPPLESGRKPGHMYRSRSHEMILEESSSRSRRHLRSDDGLYEEGLSRSSMLNERYFDPAAHSDELLPRTASLEGLGLSSHSRLNERYRSMENLTEQRMVNRNMFIQADINLAREPMSLPNGANNNDDDDDDQEWGLAQSALNDRYFGDRKTGSSNNKNSINNGHNSSPDQMGSNNNSGLIDFREFDFDDDQDSKYDRTNSSAHYVKSTKKVPSTTAHTHSTKGYLDAKYPPSDKDYQSSAGGPRSSAMSDTSEAPSLASHVRQVKVPSHTSDLDQYLDDLFNPVLEGNVDELSDARSLAASIKGGFRSSERSRRSYCGPSNVVEYIDGLLDPVGLDCAVNGLKDARLVSVALKGGGRGLGKMDVQGSTVTQSAPLLNMMMGGIQSPVTGMMSPPPLMGGNMQAAAAANSVPMNGMSMLGPINATLPLYSLGGFNLPMANPWPGVIDPSQFAMQQQLMQQQQQQAMQINASQVQQMQQRAFLASAVQQNLQIQQQLMQQNQALQQLLQQTGALNQSGAAAGNTSGNAGNASSSRGNVRQHKMNVTSTTELEERSSSQRVGFREPEHSLWSEDKRRWTTSPPPPLPPKSESSTPSPAGRGLQRSPTNKQSWKGATSTPIKDGPSFVGVLSELRSRKSSNESNGFGPPSLQKSIPSGATHKFTPTGNIPPPPPLPPELPETSHPFLNVYGRAKTVRIGKWRWPPPRVDDNGEPDNFFEFKYRQQQKRHDDSGQRFSSSSSDEKIGDSSMESSPRSSTDNVNNSKSNLSEVHQPVGSVGKLKISTEMRAKLEAVTLNHSVRSTSNKADARRVYAAVSKLKAQAKEDPNDNGRNVRKLEENRKLALQRQLGGRYPSSDFGDDGNSEVNGSIVGLMENQTRPSAFNRSSVPPPPPVAPPSFMIPPPPESTIGDTSSYYDPGGPASMPEPKSPPAPVSPSSRLVHHQNHYSSHHQQQSRNEHFRGITHMERSSYAKHVEDTPDYPRPSESVPKIITDDSDNRQFESLKTKLYSPSKLPYSTYTRTPWTLHIRKEVFSPSEQLTTPLALHIVFCQVVQDVFAPSCVRLNKDDRAKLTQMLDGYGITPNNMQSPHHKNTLKKNVVDIARECPTYFSRLYPVSGGRSQPDVEMLGVSHSGVRLIRRERDSTADYLYVLAEYSFEDIVEVSIPRGSTVQLLLRNGHRVVLFTHRALQVRKIIDQFALEADSGAHEYVRAVADYLTRESTLLSFRQGDIIRVVNKNQYLDKGWLYGILDGRTGIFPCEYVVPLGRNEMLNLVKEQENVHKATTTTTTHQHHHHHQQSVASHSVHHHQQQQQQHVESRHIESQQSVAAHRGGIAGDPGGPGGDLSTWAEHRGDFADDKSDISYMTQVNDGKHSLLQFALLNFRQSLDKYEMLRTADGSIRGSLKMIESLKSKKKGKKSKESDWTWKEQVEMVKYTKSPIQASLLKLESTELNKLALECFIAIMRYMGDYPMAKGQTDVECVYTILMNCYRHHQLRDEVYCQIMKQTTNNKSPKPDSCQKGWRLFSIIAAYFDCSDLLKPYLFKYLETAAYDKRRAYHGTAMVCLQNLRKTFKYGGRKNVPSREEITAISAGRNSKRQIYRLPGGTERVINTKSTSVVADIIEEICTHLNIRSQHEMEEFSLYCIVEGDSFTMPLIREEYILDVTTELHKSQQVFHLIFCRSVWYYPLRLDNPLYIEVVFNQIAPDYLEGLLLITPSETIPTDITYDIVKVAALLHRVARMENLPSATETKYLLPKPALSVRDIKPPEWIEMVQESWRDAEVLSPDEAKVHVLEILQKWPLFGSSFFAVKKLGEPRERGDFILAINRNGVHFLDVVTHETLYHYPFSDVISTRKVRAEDGTQFLDMKVGNLMVQKITRIQTEQAHEISRLIKQYILSEQRNRGVASSSPPNDNGHPSHHHPPHHNNHHSPQQQQPHSHHHSREMMTTANGR